MNHAFPNQTDLEAVRTALVQQFKRVEQGSPCAGMAITIERTHIRRRRAKAALDRLDAGNYGLCCLCHLSIEPEVLRFDPSASFCNDCQAEGDPRRCDVERVGKPDGARDEI